MNIVEWVDITNLCQEAASNLNAGIPMISHEQFSLHDSMSAVELMDPKMDQYCNISGSINLESLLKFVLPEPLTFDIINNVFQSLIICEVSYLDGSSLLESINQCVFTWTRNLSTLLEMKGIRKQLLFYFSLDLLNATRVLLKCILTADVYEDEDFHTQSRSGHVEDMSQFSDNTIQELLGLIDIIRNSSTNISDADAENTEGLITLEHPTAIDHLVFLVNTRIKLHSLYSSIDSVINFAVSFRSSDESDSLSAADDELASYKDNLQLCSSKVLVVKKNSDELLALLSSMEQTFTEDLPPHTENPVVGFAFNSNISRSLQVSPMRSVVFLSFFSSIKYLKKICLELQHICDLLVKVYEFVLRSTSDSEETDGCTPSLDYDYILCLVSSVSRNKYHILARSFLWGGLHGVLRSLPTLLQRSMVNRGVPVSLVRSEVCEQWTHSLQKAVWDTIRTFMHCRNHVLLRLENNLTVWSVIVRESGVLDMQYKNDNGIEDVSDRQQWALSWAVLHITNLMGIYLGIMAELELLSPSEYDYFYWYWDYVLSCRLHAFKTLRDLNYALKLSLFQTSREAAADEMKKLRSSRSLKKADKQRLAELQRIAEGAPPLAPVLTFEELVTAACNHIVKGLFRQYVVLDTFGLCSKLSNEYSTWSNRFVQRFRAFSSLVHPHALSYDSFRSIADTSTRGLASDILNGSANNFKEAKASLDELRKGSSRPTLRLADSLFLELANPLVKVCVACSVANMRLLQTIQQPIVQSSQGQTREPNRDILHFKLVVDTSHHDQFHIPSLKS